MPSKPRTTKTKKKSAPKRASRSALTSAIPSGAQDVTDDTSDVLVGKIKLLCDNDTNVHFFRSGGKLFMLAVERGGVSGTVPAE